MSTKVHMFTATIIVILLRIGCLLTNFDTFFPTSSVNASGFIGQCFPSAFLNYVLAPSLFLDHMKKSRNIHCFRETCKGPTRVWSCLMNPHRVQLLSNTISQHYYILYIKSIQHIYTLHIKSIQYLKKNSIAQLGYLRLMRSVYFLYVFPCFWVCLYIFLHHLSSSIKQQKMPQKHILLLLFKYKFVLKKLASEMRE